MTGKDITVTLSQGGVALANTRIKSNDIKTHCNTIEKASSVQQQWVEIVAARKSWSLNVSYLVLSSTQVADLLYVGQTFDITIKSGTTNLLTGKAILTDASNVATVGNLTQGSFALSGNGALAVATL